MKVVAVPSKGLVAFNPVAGWVRAPEVMIAGGSVAASVPDAGSDRVLRQAQDEVRLGLQQVHDRALIVSLSKF